MYINNFILDNSYSFWVSIFISSVLIYSNYENFLISLIGIELTLLFINLSFIETSLFLDDLYGQVFSFFVLTIAASESAIGLAIIILYYRINGTIQVPKTSLFSQKN
jgi:NADH-quinone oxidoreductase subunit K